MSISVEGMSLSPVGNRTLANNSSWEACLLQKKMDVLTVILDNFQHLFFGSGDICTV